MSDPAVTLKYGHGNWKRNEQKSSTCSIIMPSFHIYVVWENPNFNVFEKPRHLTNQKSVDYLPWIHTSHINHIVHDLFHVCSNHTTFKLQKTRIQNTNFAVYISGMPVTLKLSQGQQT